ncbi:MAG: TrgA family protein [Pseudomonadota bacterium]
MPTAGRLAAAVVFGLFGWYVAGLSVQFFPEARAPTFWVPVGAAVGLFVGWSTCGSRLGRGYNPAIGLGLTCGFALGVLMLFVVSFDEMIQNAMRLNYDGPMEAVTDVFGQMLEFAVMFYDWELIVTLLAGGVVCTFFAEFFARRFP